MTDSHDKNEGPDPDGFEVEVIDPAWDGDVTKKVLRKEYTYVPAHERGDKEPLYSASTIQAEHEQARKQVHERIREFQDEHRDVPYPVKDIVDEAFDRLEEVFQDR